MIVNHTLGFHMRVVKLSHIRRDSSTVRHQGAGAETVNRVRISGSDNYLYLFAGGRAASRVAGRGFEGAGKPAAPSSSRCCRALTRSRREN